MGVKRVGMCVKGVLKLIWMAYGGGEGLEWV